MKLKSLTKWTLNELITLPIIGDVQFNSDNEIEVDDAKVDVLLKQECGIKWDVKEKVKKKDVVEVIEDDTINPPVFNDETKLLSLEALTTKELKELLAEFPVKETKDLKSKSQIVEYLVNKI